MRGQVDVYRVPVRWADPRALSLASVLGWLHGKAIAGDNGAIRYGGPGSIQAQRSYFTGYAFPPQIFTGWNPRRVAGGRARVMRPQLPNTGGGNPVAALASPLTRAMEAVTAAQKLNQAAAWGHSDAT
jgi:hypothetical protein